MSKVEKFLISQFRVYPFFNSKNLSHRRESNPRPEVYKTPALPLSYGGITDMLFYFCTSITGMNISQKISFVNNIPH